METEEERGTIREGEYHPAAREALSFVTKMMYSNPKQWFIIRESIASTALSGVRLSEILNSTLDRIEKGAPVSDRYVLGLAWFIKDFTEHTGNKENSNKVILQLAQETAKEEFLCASARAAVKAFALTLVQMFEITLKSKE